MSGKLRILNTKADNIGRLWSVAMQPDRVRFGKFDLSTASFGVWPSGKVDTRLDSIAMVNLSLHKEAGSKLEDITVNEKYRRKGIGTFLLSEVEIWAETNAIHYIWGDLVRIDADHFDILNRFYTKCGWIWYLFEDDDERLKLGGTTIGIVDKRFGGDLQHIPRGSEMQNWFRATYRLIRSKKPVDNRRDCFLKSVADMKQVFPKFKLLELDYDVNFFGVSPLDFLDSRHTGDTQRARAIEERQAVLRKWSIFATRYNLDLAWDREDLIFKAQLFVERKGACPGISNRAKCPCNECIQECKNNGECSGRIFLKLKNRN